MKEIESKHWHILKEWNMAVLKRRKKLYKHQNKTFTKGEDKKNSTYMTKKHWKITVAKVCAKLQKDLETFEKL